MTFNRYGPNAPIMLLPRQAKNWLCRLPLALNSNRPTGSQKLGSRDLHPPQNDTMDHSVDDKFVYTGLIPDLNRPSGYAVDSR
jgi:hypothetical protein